jgi:hypothetical protein
MFESSGRFVMAQPRSFHGKRYTAEYDALMHAIGRCYNPNNAAYDRYGGRGIVVCAGWRHDFARFFADMDRKPSPKHSIDRINNDGHYSCGRCDECRANGWPMNCRWATDVEQAHNKRNNVWAVVSGERMTVQDFARLCGLKVPTVYDMLAKGWEADAILARCRGADLARQGATS